MHIFLISALVGGEWSTSRPGRFTPGERAPGTHWTGGWVDLRANLHDLGCEYVSYVFNIHVSLLQVLIISSGHHEELKNITHVIKLLVIIRIHIVATDGCVARECIFMY
jgi:hypothetical protein